MAVAISPMPHSRAGSPRPSEPIKYVPRPALPPLPNSASKEPSTAAGAATRRPDNKAGRPLRRRTQRSTCASRPPYTRTKSTRRASTWVRPSTVATMVG